MLEKLAKQWKEDRKRQYRSKATLSAYNDQWLDWDDCCRITDLLKQRYPKTWELYQCLIDKSINMLSWATGELCNIYDQAPIRTLGDQEIPTYDTKQLNLTLANAARQTFALGNLFIRPITTPKGLTYDLIPPHLATILPSKSGDPTQFDAIMYKTGPKRFVVWTADDHLVFSDSGLKNLIAHEDNPTNTNPYGIIPIVAVRAKWPSGGWWETDHASRIEKAALETIISMTQLRRLAQVASAKRTVLKGKPGKDFARTHVIDPAYPLIVAKDGDVDVIDPTADIATFLDSTLKSASAALYQEGISAKAVRGEGHGAESGYKVKLEMSSTEARRDGQRSLWELWEQELINVSRVVVDVDRRDPAFRSVAPIPPGDLSISWADTAPEASYDERVKSWTERLNQQTAERHEVIMDLDGLSEEQAREKIRRIDADNAQKLRASVFAFEDDNDNESDNELTGGEA
jgi:hypothetical protein